MHEADYVVLQGGEKVTASIAQTRYAKWVLGAVTGQLGLSTRDGLPIFDKLLARATAGAEAHVHAAHDAPSRQRLVVLRPVDGQARRGERVVVERAVEGAAVVVVDERVHEVHAVDGRGADVHRPGAYGA